MPEIIPRTLQGTPFLVEWYQWGVIVGFLLALAVTAWIFLDAQRTGRDATVWKSIAAVASVICIPALLARVHSGFAIEMRDSLLLVAMFSVVGSIGAIVAALGYAASRGRAVAACPLCGQPQDPTWTHCPYHSAPQPVAPVMSPIPITSPAPPIVGEPFGPSNFAQGSGRETLVAGMPPAANRSGPPANQPGGTVILSREAEAKPLALLIIRSGPYANTTLALKAGVNTVGRDGQMNDHPIDDPAVSSRHLSVRYVDGGFVATDLDSANGTFLNNEKIDRRPLHNNDVLRIGTTELVFVQVGESNPAVASEVIDGRQ